MSTKLTYNNFINDWMHALPLGNGRIGAMVFGNPSLERIEINEESLWSGYQIIEKYHSSKKAINEIRDLIHKEKLADAKKLSTETFLSDPPRIRYYETFCDILVDFEDKSEVVDYKKVLDLDTSIVNVSYVKSGIKFNSESFVTSNRQVFCYNLTASNKFSASITINREQNAYTSVINNETILLNGRVTFFDEEAYGKGCEGIKFGSIIKVKTDGECETVHNKINVNNASHITLYCAFRTNYNVKTFDIDDNIDYKNLLYRDIESVKNLSFNKIKHTHVLTYQKQFNNVNFCIDAPKFNNLSTLERLDRVKNGELDVDLHTLYYNYGRYLLLTSSSFKATLPANLQGIWSTGYKPAWGADYHTNINIQMNYWPSEVANCSETVKPLTHFIKMLSKFGKNTAKNLFYCKGWAMNHCTDIFGRTGVHGSVDYGFFPIAGAWLCLSLLEHYEYTCDKNYLLNIYEVIKGACLFILDYLTENEDGTLVPSPSNSPENIFHYYDEDGNKQASMLTEGATFDYEVIYALFTRSVEVFKILNKDIELLNSVELAISKLPPLKISKRYGTICEWIKDYEEWEPGHRHISHLFGLYPSDQINETNPIIFEGAKKTIERRLKFGGGQTGWSRAWIINFYARLKNGDEISKHLQELLKTNTEANLFDLHPPHIFQIDGNLGAVSGISEALLQSHLGNFDNRIIELLPALPSDWQTGYIKGLKARGNFTVDLFWNDSKLTKCLIKSCKGKLLRIKLPSNVELSNKNCFSINNGIYEKETSVNEEIELNFN